jgi:hypothetical protein
MRLWSPCRGWFPDMGWCLSQHLIRCDRSRPACSPCCGEHAQARPQGCLIALCTRFRRDRPGFGVPIDDGEPHSGQGALPCREPGKNVA